MRALRPLLVAVATVAVLALVPVASAHAGGGAAFVTPAGSGGAAYGSPPQPVDTRPIASFLEVTPHQVRAGQMPTVRFRIRQRGVAAVSARVMILPLGKRRPTVDLELGELPIGHTHTVRWPERAALAAGRYRVSLHATDPTGRTLERRGERSGQAVLRVIAPPPPPPQPEPIVPAAPAPPVLPGADGVFPVAGPHGYGGDDAVFGAGRRRHTHQGQDIVAAAGVAVVAPTAGTVIAVDYQAGGAGYYVTLHSVDGRDFFFCHFQKGSTAVALNQVVGAGTLLGRVGATGSASGPHLHFEIWPTGWQHGDPIDPLAQLQAWEP
jgi:murein DD-endopeptidase MepM/ murein hydrolase activator NlpD